MAKKQHEAKASEVLENPDLLADKLVKAEDFVKNNQNLLTYIGVGIAAVIGLVIGVFYYLTTQEEEAQAAMFPAVYLFEKDSFDLALNGNGINAGLLEIADQYGITKAGKLASFYSGIAYLKKGQPEEALEYLDNFSSSDAVLQAKAYCLMGDAHMEQQSYQDAASYYKKAATYKVNKQFTPGYLMKWGLASELSQDNKNAVEAYKTLIREYPLAPEVNDAKKYLGKLLPLVN